MADHQLLGVVITSLLFATDAPRARTLFRSFERLRWCPQTGLQSVVALPTLKFLVAGPVTVTQLIRVRARGARARRRATIAALGGDTQAVRFEEPTLSSTHG